MYAIRVNENTANQVQSKTQPVCSDSGLVGFFIGDNMKKIPLTQGQYALVDDIDFESLNQKKWQAAKTQYGGYTASSAAPRTNKHISMHRLIANAPEGMDVDHRDHNTLNNQRDNLRVCNRMENKQNGKPYKGGSSVFKGVHWLKRGKRWQVSIRKNRKKIHLGYFDDEIVAAQAYDKAANKLFGEFANLNF